MIHGRVGCISLIFRIVQDCFLVYMSRIHIWNLQLGQTGGTRTLWNDVWLITRAASFTTKVLSTWKEKLDQWLQEASFGARKSIGRRGVALVDCEKLYHAESSQNSHADSQGSQTRIRTKKEVRRNFEWAHRWAEGQKPNVVTTIR